MVIKLKDICDVRDGTHDSPIYVDNGYPLVTSKNIVEGKLDLSVVNYISLEDYNKINERSNVDDGDIIMPMIGTIGNPCLVQGYTDFAIKNVALIKFPNDEIKNKFVLYFLKSDAFKRYVASKNKGGTQKFLSLGDIRNIEIPQLSTVEQEEIVCRLDKVDSVIRLREEELKQLDNLIKSRFIELFGTPLLNEKGWKVKNTGDVCSVTDGSHFSPVGKESGYPMLSVRNMRNDGFHYDDCKLVSKEDYDVLAKQGCKPLKNDVLIAKDGSYFYYGFVVKEEIEQAVLSSIAILRPNLEEIHPEYLCRYMLSSEIVDLVGKNYVTGAAIKRVILKGIKQIPVMLPPIDLQNQFAAFVEQTDKSKVKVQQSLDETQILMDSLMQKYFG